LFSKIIIRVTCADIPALLNAINASDISLRNVSIKDDLSICITIKSTDIAILRNICNKYSASWMIVDKCGLYYKIIYAIKRPVLMLLLCTVVFLSCYLPSRILFVSVEGNKLVPTNKILEAAENCGIALGANRRQVRSEKMKNSLLQAIPELQWAGINTTGCVAVISVGEKSEKEILSKQDARVSSIVASRDGIIQSYTVQHGNALCSIGQAVKKGQVLISGYTDCGIVTKATQAQAEVKAYTYREIEAVSPAPVSVRGDMKTTNTQYAIRIGKKLIKLYKDSGNLGTTCAKIYEERYAKLPGGYILPIALVKETTHYFELAPIQNSQDSDWLRNYCEEYLCGIMISGEFVSTKADVSVSDNAAVLLGKYMCLEMIGTVKYEQMMLEGE
jgi:sporulation protein YqfD